MCIYIYIDMVRSLWKGIINLIGILPKNYTSWIDIFRFILGINDIQYSWRYVLTEINCSTYIHIMSCFHFPGLLSYNAFVKDINTRHPKLQLVFRSLTRYFLRKKKR